MAMRFRVHVIGVLVVSLLLAASPVRAQQHVISAADLQQAMVDKAAADEASRDLVRSVLRHDVARSVAERLSLDLTRAEQAVATLEGEELAAVAATAETVDRELSGEQQYVTISLTALLIIIILILLIA
jgi:hypothetical protein